MKFVKQSYELDSPVRPDLLEWLEHIGRKSHQSEPKGTPEEFMKMLLRRGHESVLEHYNVTAIVKTDRGITHEIVRHRIGAYTQESTRYCNYKEGLEFIKADETALYGTELRPLLSNIEWHYKDCIYNGVRPQHARAILPNCLRAEIVITYNLRIWRHFFKMRCAKDAHPQIREIANGLRALLQEKISIIFDDNQTREYLDTQKALKRLIEEYGLYTEIGDIARYEKKKHE